MSVSLLLVMLYFAFSLYNSFHMAANVAVPPKPALEDATPQTHTK
jgi:hypothetical protein